MKINQLAIAALATLLSGSSLVAQRPDTRQPAQLSPSRQQQGDSNQAKDQTFARSLAIANQEQVAIAGFAQENATTDKVKQFAATMEKEHQSYLEQLNKISPQSGSISHADTSTSASAGNNSTREGRTTARDGSTTAITTTFTIAGNNSSSVDFLQLQQEISTQCLQDSKEYLSQKEGVEFDKCFIAMQVAKHAGMHSTLTVLERHATGKLQDVVKVGLEKNSQHMKMAVNLMKQLDENKTTKLTQASK